MAADDAAVVVTLRADLKGYEAALKSAVRATEKAAKAAQDSVSSIGRNAKPDFGSINDNFQKSAGQLANDAKVLQFQLNDIFSGLASGQGIRALQVQLGQIAQQMSGGSLAQGARLMGSAMLGMINPINLAVVAFGFAATAAAAYFSGAEKDAEAATKKLEQQADALDKLADKYGAIFPELSRAADKLREQAEAAGLAVAKQTALDAAYEDSKKSLIVYSEKVTEMLAIFEAMGAPIEIIRKFQNAFNDLRKAIDDHNASAETAGPLLQELNDIIDNGHGKVVKLATAIRDELTQSFQELDRAAKSAGDTIQRSLEFQMPGAGGPLDLSPLIRARTDALDKSLGKASGAIDSFVEHVIKAESGGSATAKNPLSTATGAGQFIESTWLRVMQQHFPAEIVGKTRAEVLAMRNDLEISRRAIRAYASDNAQLLLEGGQEVNEAALQLAHFLGPGGAMKILEAPRGTPVSDILPQKTIEANKSILGGGATREDVLAYAQRRAGMEGVTKAAREQKTAFDDLFAANQARLDQAMRELGINRDSTLSSDQKKLALNAEAAAAEEAQIKEQLLNAAKSQGLTITPELTAKINEQAHAMAQAGLSAANLAVAQSAAAKSAADAAREAAKAEAETAKAAAEAQQVANQVAGIAQGAILGLVRDLRSGTDAAEAFYNALSNIADQLLSMALNMAFKSILGGMFGAPALGGGLFASGGYTGDIGKNKPAGIVHGKEFVVNAAATQKHRAMLEAINNGMPGYASGGFVLPSMRGNSMPAASQRAPASVDARTTVVNTFDAGSFLSEALSRPDGVKVILNAVRAQPSAFRQAMQS